MTKINQIILTSSQVNKLKKALSDIEEILEDLEMMTSKNYRNSILKARRDAKKGKLYKLDLKTGNLKKI